ncbi:MAG: ATP-binding protein [SAR324 cluster bacterium]|nr:ATP-binding protein [SAR324 cluster bacterium]
MEDFDFSFDPSIKRRHIMDLATCRFIRERRDILLTGPPGRLGWANPTCLRASGIRRPAWGLPSSTDPSSTPWEI